MSGLPWVRLDANIGTHDKLAPLQLTPDGRSAFVLYVCALGWAGGHGTDGHIPKHVLSFVAPGLPKRPKLAQLLVEAGLWEYVEGGWSIVNYLERQQSSIVTEAIGQQRSAASAKGNCRRWHGPDCGCWMGSQQGSQVRSDERTDERTHEEGRHSQPIVELRYAREKGTG
jgi:hypothetical protein